MDFLPNAISHLAPLSVLQRWMVGLGLAHEKMDRALSTNVPFGYGRTRVQKCESPQ
jgi:hypothetical protein